ncbi:MAG: DUF4131 domain-containing protein, partial [Gammaproteobacteria bacterium]|nr:DUF4131 domain-containing protein [Gammaproteobacteria bacterium]
MFTAALSFLAGNLLLHQFTSLPEWFVPLWLMISLIVALALFVTKSGYTILKATLWGAIGLLFSLHFAQERLSERLPNDLAGADIDVVGTIASIPQLREGDAIRFRFVIEQAHHRGVVRALPELVRVSWYKNRGEQPKAGERWQLRLRLKPPNGSLNPGGFDYERWLFQEGIGATGYVRQSSDNRRLTTVSPYSLSAIRSGIYNQMSSL